MFCYEYHFKTDKKMKKKIIKKILVDKKVRKATRLASFAIAAASTVNTPWGS
jgi:hypothetical protein